MQIKPKKKCSQNMLIFLCWLVYTVAYFGRYSYNANISLVMDNFKTSHADAGLVTTFFFFAYGIGQFINAFMSKRYNKRFLFPIVLILSSVLNLTVAVGIPFRFIKYAWLVNGLLQSCLWSSIVSVTSRELDSKHLNKAIFVLSTTASAGTLFTYGFSALFVRLGDYRISFIFGACIMTFVGLMWLRLYRPKSDTVEAEKKESEVLPKERAKPNFTFVLLIIILGIFGVTDNFIKDGLSTWVPVILKEQYRVGDDLSILPTIVLPLLGMFGATFSYFLNKRIHNFITLSALFFAFSAVFLGAITFCSGVGVIAVLLCFGIIVCLMHGVNNIITSISPLKMRAMADSGRMAGILNACCYAGSTISSYGLGAVADRGSWQTVFVILFAACLLSLLIGLIYLFAVGTRVNYAGDATDDFENGHE